MNRVFLVFSLCLVAVVVGCGTPTTQTGVPRPTAERITIGSYLPLTGDVAVFGQSSKNGMELALSEINAGGGVLGKQLALLVEDDGSKANQVPALAKKLINRDRVSAIIGELTSSATLEGAPLCQVAGVPMVTPAATNPDITKQGDYVFRVCFTDDFQGKVCAVFAAKNLKARRAAILKDIRSAYSKGLAAAFAEHLKKLGAAVVAEESFSAGDTDFGAQLIKIEAAAPDVLFIPGYYNDVGLIVRQARQRAGLGKCALLGGDGWDGPPLVEIAGKAIEGGFFASHYSVDDPRPEVGAFVAAYKAKYGAVPDAMAALGYDALKVVADAIRRAGKADRAAIRDALAATKDFTGVTGTITIDTDRNCVKPAVILQIKDGSWKYVTSVAP